MLISSTRRTASRNTSVKAQYLLICNKMTVHSYIIYEPWYILLLTQRLKELALSKCVWSFSPHTRKHGHSTGPKQKSCGAPKKNAADNQIHQYHQPRCLTTIIYGTLSHKIKGLGCLQKSIDEHFSSHTHEHRSTHTTARIYIYIYAFSPTHPPYPLRCWTMHKHTLQIQSCITGDGLVKKKKKMQNQNAQEKRWVFLFDLKEGNEWVNKCVCVRAYMLVCMHSCRCRTCHKTGWMMSRIIQIKAEHSQPVSLKTVNNQAIHHMTRQKTPVFLYNKCGE